ncbi:tumor necrosis factor ligand superfamily member 6-like isoform X1 [Astyanax mexicanus]|uniref:CD40 ligand n=1 Tax=Astyanax mexicanus TaxID=7994 RepID=A0A8B9HB85_ASTMX|nr:tumor necrosis factor ligand superfamily member 6-like isoform X1 [Astyanax mexicanus]
MINTFHTSYNHGPVPPPGPPPGPPPVPPRQGYRGPVLPTNTSLVKFLSVMMLLLMILTFGGFFYMFHRLNVQVEFNMCMASRLDRLTPEQRENCLKLVGNSWGTGQDGKVAFLSGRGFYTLPAARLVLTKKTPGIKVKDQLNTLYWDQNHSMTKKINLNSDGSFTVEQPGYYYIYSQVSFSKGHPKVPLRQTLWTRKPDKDKKQEADWKELLMSYCSLPQSSPVSNVCTASQAGVFELQKNQQLRVNVTSSDLVNEESTTLGLFKLQD